MTRLNSQSPLKLAKRLAAALGCAAGAGLALYALVYGLSEQRRQNEISDKAATEYAAHTTYQEQQACRAVPKLKLAQCRRDAKAQYAQRRYDARRDYDNLVAQQRSALWTSITGVAAITGMMLSAIGVALVYTTFRETKRSADAAMKSYDAFTQFESAVIDVDFCGSPRFPLINNERHIYFDLKLSNVGRSPAIVEKVQMKGEKTHFYRKILGGGKEFNLQEDFVLPIPAGGILEGYVEYITAISPGKKPIFIVSADTDNGVMSATIHPYAVIDESEEGYEDPFE